MKKRYVQVSRKEQRRLLNEMEAVTELHRKSLIRLINGSLERQSRQRQRGRTYGSEVNYALNVIAESFDYLCAERLTPNLVWMANHLAHHGELEVSPLLLEKLDQTGFLWICGQLSALISVASGYLPLICPLLLLYPRERHNGGTLPLVAPAHAPPTVSSP